MESYVVLVRFIFSRFINIYNSFHFDIIVVGKRRISNRLLIVNFPPMCKEMEQGTVAHRRLGMKAISKPRHVDERLMKIIFISFRLFTSFL